MEQVIHCEYEYDKKVSFALQQNHVPVIKFLAIKNASIHTLNDIKIEIIANPNFSDSYSMNIEELDAGEIIEVHPDLFLSFDFLSSLDEEVTGHLQLKITSGEQELYKEYLPIDILSFDSWPGSSVLPEIIASFITPNRPFIMEIVKQASEILEKNTGNNAMDGYQSGDPNRALAQLSAIFSAIQSHQIAYANPPASFEQEGQKIRFPDMIKQHKLATCLDSTLLFAACAEAIGLHPIVVFLQGHAFPAFWLKEYCSSESFQDDKSILTKNMASGISELIVVESTLLTNMDATFKSAVQSAKNSLDKQDSFHYFIDVRRARIGQVKPFSLKIDKGAMIKGAAEVEGPVKPNKNYGVEQLDIIPDNESDSNELGQQEDKVTYWQNRLIDMSLRNNLLNFRLHTQGIPVVSSDLAQTEDILAMGKKVFIEPLPNEWRNKARDFRDQKELLQSQILQEDMQNNRLRSTLTDTKLEKELVKLYRKAKNTLEESGANSLFVALGFLKWYDPKSQTQERFAPILLLPVDLVRMSAKKGYYIRARDEEVQINISLIEYLKQKFGIDASRLYDIPIDDHGADVKKVLTTMRRLIMPMKNWDVQENASISVFSFSKFVMWNDLVNHSEKLKENKVVKSLVEGNYVGEVNEAMTEPLTTEKDEEETLYTPLSSDSTQTEAILATGGDNSFVLHGPPGSGKSQTITNMISHALATGKTVLFVAEKMAALSVVQKRLADIGLGDFCLEVYSNKGQKKDILAQLETSFEAQQRTKGTEWGSKYEEITELKKELNQYVQDLHKPTTIGQSIFEMIEVYSDMKTATNTIEFNREKVKNMDEVTFRKSKQLIEDIAIAGEACGDLGKNVWTGIKQTDYSLKLHDDLKKELTAIEEKSQHLLEIENDLEKLGLTSKKKDHPWYKFVHTIILSLQNRPKVNFALLGEENFDKTKKKILEVISNGQKRDEKTKIIEERFDKSIIKMDTESLLQELRLAENSWFFKKLLGKNKITKELKKYLKAKDKIGSDELETIIASVQDIQEKQKTLDDNDQQMKIHFPNLWHETEGQWTDIETAVEWLTSTRSIIEEFNGSQSYLAGVAQALQDNNQLLTTSEMKEQIETYTTTYETIMKSWETIEKELVATDFHEPQQSDWVNFAREKASRLINSLPQLKDNCNLSRVVQEAETFGLGHVTAPYLRGEINHKELLSSYLYGVYRIRIDEEITSNESLAQFTRASFENKLKKFNELDDEISELTKLEVYVKLMERVPNLMNNAIKSSEPGILLKAIKSKGRGIALRQLFERIPNLLPKIKPCMLMSPLSVAQYLDPSSSKFDLVIFDEASQLPTSEAIGAMARGKNVVVVGDPKQLPPTSFFSSQQQTEDDFDLQDLESVLDDSLSIRMPQKHLRWHYRSEHESLISFSNNHFYENKLVTFPSIDDIVSRVSFRNVGGTYDRGKTRSNKIEAEVIVEEIFSRLKDPLKQHESIGIVTFSQVQQTLIEDMIDERLKQDATLEKYFTDEVQEPVFVKNLENVQGDERDVILFTVGYGPDETGHMTLNFGPLNRDGGWRRLNVAVSRAKKEMVIIASMEPDQINLSRTKAEGVHSLRAFMEFAKRGNEPLLLENRIKNGRPNSSSIIPIIQKALQEQGYQVDTNVGSSEFKVDLAVVDKKREGNYIAAVQIDGHRYANRSTTRDRNKLTDTMLDRLGWHIIKVWSIEWWHNEKEQIDNLLAQLKEFENNSFEKVKPKVPVSKNKQESFQEKISSLIIPEAEKESKEDYYEPALLEDVNMDNDSFYTVEGMPTIRAQIKQIIEQEAPVSFSQLTKSITNSWGFSRSGAKLEKVINDSVKGMMLYETTDKKGKFLWKDEEQFKTYNEFRIKDRYRRALQDISKTEYANGILKIMHTSLRLPKQDLTREIARQLGYNRTSNKLESYMQEAIDLAVDKGLITEDEEGNVEINN
ncbi:DUF3320 domain-containing protein [Virgibacillus salinus]|uniref:Superfamily I DNA and/or RNA helicase n=1 Tax=Virgibacillus salinus TaxID=553311 RepID=A0A1H1ESV0_9BACI|nr:DUF3320 domain-containing protein [Virgibacillus salinus]SDQ91835.1 Superfamily I DNA and/or RNA helicase [Virgibacillus salinus]